MVYGCFRPPLSAKSFWGVSGGPKPPRDTAGLSLSRLLACDPHVSSSRHIIRKQPPPPLPTEFVDFALFGFFVESCLSRSPAARKSAEILPHPAVPLHGCKGLENGEWISKKPPDRAFHLRAPWLPARRGALALKLSDLLTRVVSCCCWVIWSCPYCLWVTVSGKVSLFCSDDSRNRGLRSALGDRICRDGKV